MKRIRRIEKAGENMNADRLFTQSELHGKSADPFIQDGGHSLMARRWY